jgi:hypothetical protein
MRAQAHRACWTNPMPYGIARTSEANTTARKMAQTRRKPANQARGAASAKHGWQSEDCPSRSYSCNGHATRPSASGSHECALATRAWNHATAFSCLGESTPQS